jgi:hypothetical protein
MQKFLRGKKLLALVAQPQAAIRRRKNVSPEQRDQCGIIQGAKDDYMLC